MALPVLPERGEMREAHGLLPLESLVPGVLAGIEEEIRMSISYLISFQLKPRGKARLIELPEEKLLHWMTIRGKQCHSIFIRRIEEVSQ